MTPGRLAESAHAYDVIQVWLNSARAAKGATVSTPLTWDEIESGLSPSDFTIDNVPARIAKVGDLWAKGMKKPNDLEQLGKKRGKGRR